MDYVSKYAEFLKKHIDIRRPIKIVCDVSNGTTGIVLERLVGIPNMELVLINATPDPEFPTHGPNPLAPGATDMLSQKVLEVKADFGVAFDADGDRAFFVGILPGPRQERDFLAVHHDDIAAKTILLHVLGAEVFFQELLFLIRRVEEAVLSA